MFYNLCLIVWCFSITEAFAGDPKNDTLLRTNREPRPMEYVSLLGTLLQQTSILSSMYGVLLAMSTIAATALARSRPILVASVMSYLLYAGTALLAPDAALKMGVVTARSATGSVVAEAIMRSIQFSPIMNIVTNVSVSVITDVASRLRILVRSLNHRLRWAQTQIEKFSTFS